MSAPTAMKMPTCSAWRCGLPHSVGSFALSTMSSEIGTALLKWFCSGPSRPKR